MGQRHCRLTRPERPVQKDREKNSKFLRQVKAHNGLYYGIVKRSLKEPSLIPSSSPSSCQISHLQFSPDVLFRVEDHSSPPQEQTLSRSHRRPQYVTARTGPRGFTHSALTTEIPMVSSAYSTASASLTTVGPAQPRQHCP